MTHSHSNITVFSNLDALSSILCCDFIDLCDRRRSINFTRLIDCRFRNSFSEFL